MWRGLTSLGLLLVAAIFAAAADQWALLSSPIAWTTLALIAIFAVLLQLHRGNISHRYIVWGFLCLGAVALAATAVTARDYIAHNEVLDRVETAIDEYREIAAGVINQNEIGDDDIHSVIAPLDKLRFMPLGYTADYKSLPLAASFGGGRQYERLRRANIGAYYDALDRLFLPRLIYRLEQLLEMNIRDAAFVSEALEVYLMLGNEAAMDEDLVQTWMARDWANLYPGSGNAKGRERLMEHLEAALSDPWPIERRSWAAVKLNAPLVQEAQRTLARTPVADR